MTGEITLRGKVLPVGGIKEKILAAKRSGIKEIILCQDNRKDIEEIKHDYLDGLTFHYVRKMEEVIPLALEVETNTVRQSYKTQNADAWHQRSFFNIDIISSLSFILPLRSSIRSPKSVILPSRSFIRISFSRHNSL